MGRPKGSANKVTVSVPQSVITTTGDDLAYLQVANPLEKRIDKLCAAMEHVADKLDRFFEGRLSSQAPATTTATTTTVTVSAESQMSYVPMEYRSMVSDMLNKDFEIEVVPLSDSPAFHFIVIVPEKYSTISDEYKRMYKRDMRPKVITYSEGLVGVRSFVEKVWSSFNPTIQALIVNDRTP